MIVVADAGDAIRHLLCSRMPVVVIMMLVADGGRPDR